MNKLTLLTLATLATATLSAGGFPPSTYSEGYNAPQHNNQPNQQGGYSQYQNSGSNYQNQNPYGQQYQSYSEPSYQPQSSNNMYYQGGQYNTAPSNNQMNNQLQPNADMQRYPHNGYLSDASSEMQMQQQKTTTAQTQQMGQQVDPNTDEAFKIRRALQTDTSLSINARNAQVAIDSNGNVTLTGTVRNDHEKEQVEKIARKISGAGDVTNKLRIQGN